MADLGGSGVGLESEGGKRELPSVAMVGGGREGVRRRQECEDVGDDTASQVPSQVLVEVRLRGIHVPSGVFGPSSSAPRSVATFPRATGPGVSAARSRAGLHEVPKARQLGFGRISGRPKLGCRVTAIGGGLAVWVT